MTDKSFGDHTNRNIVKNPLLSTAVTGLSIEDLTYNAVLLPVSQAQEVITRPDQTGPADRTLHDPENVATRYPPGDPNANFSSPQTLSTSPFPPQTLKTEKPSTSTVSKASAKSDDFDVNEYFARLQGTRYVSAPLNSVIKEDKNANLEATEENLEEINLNDDKTDAPQSFTSDIAQNFSQLPTVLPQVASAVFSSFSNMLSMKSREHTPLPPNQTGYQEVHTDGQMSQMLTPDQKTEEVQLMGVSGFGEARDVAPPPREPQGFGTSNYPAYRLPTKKKYAQIPGLTTGDKAQIPSYNPVSQTAPSYFIPTSMIHSQDSQRPIDQQNVLRQNLEGKAIEGRTGDLKEKVDSQKVHSQTSYNIFNPDTNYAPPKAGYDGETVSSTLPSSQTYQSSPESFSLTQESNQAGFGAIPPPPMFSNAPRRDSQPNQGGVGRTVLPPSVARRISANHPVMKPQTHTPFAENIFVPAPVSDAELKQEETETTNFQQPQSAFASYGPTAQQTTAIFTPLNIPSVDSTQNIGNIAPPAKFASDSALTSESFQIGDSSTGPEGTSMLPEPHKSMPVCANAQKLETLPPPTMFSKPSFAQGAPFTLISSSVPSSVDNKAPPLTFSASSEKPSNLIPSGGIPSLTSGSQNSTAPPPMLFSPSNFPAAALPPMYDRDASKQESGWIQETQNLPPPPTFFNPGTIQQSTIEDKVITHTERKTEILENHPAPPVFFNPSAMQTVEGPKVATGIAQKDLPGANQFFQPSASAEPPKVMPQPPKAAGNLNYRMTKKKPQYYAGPIAGVGAISNNVKSTIQSVETGAYQGALFTPAPVQEVAQVANAPSVPNIDHSTVPFSPDVPVNQAQVPFDISRPADDVTTFTAIGSAQGIPNHQDYNTVFDVSRPPADMFEPQKQESKGFGIIGSLKSKLSAIDINKIQNSVTNFFDPAYNDVNKDMSQSNNTISSTTNMPSFEHYAHSQGNQGSNFEIFVPTADQQLQYQAPNQQQYQTQYLYDHYPDQGQNYPPFSYYTEGENSGPSSREPSLNPIHSLTDYQHVPENTAARSNADMQATNVRESDDVVPPIGYNVENHQIVAEPEKKFDQDVSKSDSAMFFEAQPQKVATSAPQLTPDFETAKHGQFYPVLSTPLAKDFFANPYQIAKDRDARESREIEKLNLQESNSFNTSEPQPSFGIAQQHIPFDASSAKDFSAIQPTQRTVEFDTQIQSASQNPTIFTPKYASGNLFDTPQEYGLKKDEEYLLTTYQQPGFTLSENPQITSEEPENREVIYSDSDFPSENKRNILSFEKSQNDQKQVSSTPLYGLSAMLANKSRELADLEQNMENLALQDTSRNINTIFNRGSNVSFFDMDQTNSKVKDDSQESADLKICEACNEVILPETEPTELTKQLIENIIAPIQLSNPVVVPLTESETLIKEPDNFDINQFQEISHITEETIETIQVQSATELLDDEHLNANASNYGWCPDKPVDSKVIPEHDFTLQGPPIPIGFLGGSLFLDSPNPSIPKNASDELKAEYKCHEESPVNLSRQISVASAPPIEDEDTKSDETIDVHSIEQDASKDFPGEEFIIEPSETDDDKIEYRERENSNAGETEDEVESFTSRVEKFKQLDQIVNEVIEKTSPIFGFSATSPSLPIASYFDTGNYAAETHFKNLSTPSSFGHFSIGSPPQMRIPPGFEEQYQRRLSGLSNPGLPGPNKSDTHQVPDTSTQTRPTFSPTFTTAQRRADNTTAEFVVASKMMDSPLDPAPICNEKEDYPEFDMFGVKRDNKILPLQTALFGNIELADKTIKNFQSDHKTGLHDVIKQPDASNLFGAVKEETNIPHRLDTFSAFTQQRQDTDEAFKSPVIPNIFGNMEEEICTELTPATYPKSGHQERSLTEATKVKNPSTPNLPKLPDPMNFFSTVEPATQKEAGDNSCNRLASYFAAPAKAEPNKSFFELSQGQNHYRQNWNPHLDTTIKNRHTENLTSVENKEIPQLPSQGQTLLDNKSYNTNPYNIPQTQYIANLNLIKDLTSPQNFQMDPEQVVKTVNYFTVEYDNENPILMSDINIGEPEHNKRNPNYKHATSKDVILDNHIDDNTLKTIINKCKNCCDFKMGYVQTYFNVNHEHIKFNEEKVKQCMDTKKSDNPRYTSDSTMESKPDRIQSVTVTLDDHETLNSESSEGVVLNSENRSGTEYSPVKHHWFYRVDVDGKSIWRGFSAADSEALELAHQSSDLTEDTRVATDGGRFDVNILGRLRIPVYWKDKPTNVRRCSWFYKGTTDARYVPYTEAVAEKLEEEYRHGMTTGEWHRRLVLPSNELVVMHGPAVMVHFLQQDSASDAFGSPPMFDFGKRVYRNPLKIRVSRDQMEKVDHLVFMVHGAGEYRHQRDKIQSTMRPRVVRRGHDESEIEDFEPSNIDHLLLLCHGVGSACDMRFRSVEEVVDDFRSTSLQLLQSHYRNSYDNGVVGRVEVLPISWHSTLHSGEMGVDRRLARITLDSIPRLRSFTNDTVLDVLFYTSPVFCQTIIDTVCSELNRIYKLFCSRNPNFNGGVSLGGHSLGSVILYDLLGHQIPAKDLSSKAAPKQFVQGLAGTGQHAVNYPKLDFSPVALYALGSPIAIFECIRGVESLGTDFKLPTCRNFFNIFHPYDPIAYRIEPLVNQQLKNVKPFLIPHHKGRKRMHLELKDTMQRVGADLKQKLVESIKSTWANVWRTQTPHRLEKVVEEEIEREQLSQAESKDDHSQEEEKQATPEMLGKLNNGRRIDYVLQEAPFEMINEYLFAMSSHVCYWESEDTMLLMLREIYDGLGVQPDTTVPQANMTVQRTRPAAGEETVVANVAEYPSTSRGQT